MKTVNIHQAKTQLSRLIEKVLKGESFIIAKAGKPVARLTRLDTLPGGRTRRLGFLVGQLTVPDDFDKLGQDEIALLFSAQNQQGASKE